GQEVLVFTTGLRSSLVLKSVELLAANAPAARELDVREYVVFERNLSDERGAWRLAGKLERVD
ncbi:hypothetical protein HK405_001572, partial [Cladochytrium tenue]